MKIALVGAEFEENLAVRCLMGALQRAGHQVVQFVFNEIGQLEECAQALAQANADIVGMSMVFTYRAREFARLATRIKELGSPCHLIAGGHFAAFHATQLLQEVPAIDSVGCGEGEEIMAALANAKGNLAGVAGLVWRNGPSVVVNPKAIKPVDLDRLAIPPRKDPLDSYLGLGITNILSSRGCTHSCAFCSIAAWHQACGGPRFRVRSVSAVADEMAALAKRGARIFNFHDDNFLLGDKEASLQRLDSFRKELDARKLPRFAFAIKARPDSVDPDVFSLLKSMGLFRVFLGIESGTPLSLQQLGRRQTVQDNVRALQLTANLDIHTCFNLLVLNPDSTLEDLAGNAAFLRTNCRNPMNFCRTEVYTGTPLEQRLRRTGRLLGDMWGWDYQILDPRAQLAFEIIRECFESRNYGQHGLHHLAMQVDYEHQLLSHFLGTTEELRKAVKDYIQVVNVNTCDHLDAIIDAADATQARCQKQEVIAGRKHRIEQDNGRLASGGDDLLTQIRARASDLRRPSRPWKVTASAAVAATVALMPMGCQKGLSHATETAPAPMDAGGDDARVASYCSEMIAHPSTVTSDAGDSGREAGTDARSTVVDAAADRGDTGSNGQRPPVTHYHERIAAPPILNPGSHDEKTDKR